MRISDWSSDVCSSDLRRDKNWRTIQGCLTAKRHRRRDVHWGAAGPAALGLVRPPRPRPAVARAPRRGAARTLPRVAPRGHDDRKSVGLGEGGAGRGDLGCPRTLKKKKNKQQT